MHQMAMRKLGGGGNNGLSPTYIGQCLSFSDFRTLSFGYTLFESAFERVFHLSTV